MEVDYRKTDDLNAKMTVRISRADYEPKYREELLTYRKKASLKGFRKGKAPFAFIKKMFGQEVLVRTVMDMVSKSVNDYLRVHEIPYIGRPLPEEGQEQYPFDPDNLLDEYTYTFDIGLLPDFEIRGLDEEIEWMDVPVTEEEVEEEWNDLLRRHGAFVSRERAEDMSRLKLHIPELDDPESQDDAKENSRWIYMHMLSDEVCEKVIGKQIGESIDIDPAKFLKNGDVQEFKQYFAIKDENLSLPNRLEARILEIESIQPAEPNEKFFKNAFINGTVNSVEEAKAQIRQSLKAYQDAQSDVHLSHMIEHRLIDENQFELPQAFIERLVRDDKEDTGSVAEEGKDTKALSTLEANQIRWMFIKDKLANRFHIEVTNEDITRAAVNQVVERFGTYLPYDTMRELVQQMMSNEDTVSQLRNRVRDSKLFAALKEHMPLVKKETSKEAFEAARREHMHTHEADHGSEPENTP